MRIISGSRRGKNLLTLEGGQVRPTTNMVKEALFNILQFGIQGRRFLDLWKPSAAARKRLCLWTAAGTLCG